jgi:hypothetical protein
MTLLENDPLPVKDWEIIADDLSEALWSWDSVSAVDSDGRTIWIFVAAVAHGGIHPNSLRRQASSFRRASGSFFGRAVQCVGLATIHKEKFPLVATLRPNRRW